MLLTMLASCTALGLGAGSLVTGNLAWALGFLALVGASLGGWLGQLKFSEAHHRLARAEAELAACQEREPRVQELLDVVTKARDGDLTPRPSFETSDLTGRLALALSQLLDDYAQRVQELQGLLVDLEGFNEHIGERNRQQEQVAARQLSGNLSVLDQSRKVHQTVGKLIFLVRNGVVTCAATSQLAQESQSRYQELREIMDEMVEASDAMLENLSAMKERSQAIDMVITTFVKVAHDTNLLGLNAAIQAQHAGPYGAGFGVVAQEIRRVAERNSVSALDIESTVLELQASVESGWGRMQQFRSRLEKNSQSVLQMGELLAVVGRHVQGMTPELQQAVESVECQSQGTQQIMDQMQEVTDLAEQNARSARIQGEGLADGLRLTQKLQSIVKKFA